MAAVSTSGQDTVLTEFNDLQSAVNDIESRLSQSESLEIPDDVLPAAAQEMGSGQ